MEKELTAHSLPQALSLRRSTAARPRMGGCAMPEEYTEVLFLDDCEEFRRIDTDGTWVHIGAGCTAAQLAGERLAPEILKAAAAMCPEERSGLASLGGAVCSAGSAVLCALSALDARVTVASENGRRTMPLSRFRRNGLNLASDELLCEILVPDRRDSGWTYEKNSDGLTFAASLRWEKRRIAYLTVAFGFPGAEVIRYSEFERELYRLSPKEARELRNEFVEAYRRHWPAADTEQREILLRRLDSFLQENGI